MSLQLNVLDKWSMTICDDKENGESSALSRFSQQCKDNKLNSGKSNRLLMTNNIPDRRSIQERGEKSGQKNGRRDIMLQPLV